MKKSMKALFMASMLPVMMLMAAVTLTSCEGMLDDIFGEWSRPTNQQNNEPTEDEIEAAQIREAVALLEEAQKEGSITTMYFTVSGTDYEATFKKVGTEFVLQELKSTKAATRAGDDLEAKLELIEVEDDGDDEGDYDDGDEDGNDDDGDDGDDDGDDEEGDDDEEDDPDDGTTWYDVDDSSDEDGGSGADTKSNEIHKVSGTRGNVPVNLGMPVASNQMMHFTVTSKTTGEMLINFHTNMGNSETMAECVTGTVSTIVHHSISVNGKTRTLGSGDKECKIMLPNGNMVILKHKNSDEKWNTLIKKHKKFSATKKYVMYDRKYWVLKNGNAVKRSAKVKYSNYTSSTKVSGLSLSTNVKKNEYSNNIEQNNFRKGDKIRVKVNFDTESKGAKMRDAFGIKDATSSVSVRKIEGNKNVFEIEAIEEPTGNAELKEFSVTFTYKDYDNVAKSIIFTGYIKLDKTSDQVTAEINELYAKSVDFIVINAAISEWQIHDLVGDFLGSATTLTETYAKPLAEKVCKEKKLGGVVLFMGGNDTNGYDFYVISDDSNSKTHLAFDDAIPAAWEGLTLFYVSK